MKMKASRFLGTSLLGLALFASVTTACVHKPEMHLDHAEISGMQLATVPPGLNIVMTVVLNVYNPNSYDVAIRGVRGQTVIGGMGPVPVTYVAPPPDGLWLPAGQTTAVRVPITLPVALVVALAEQGVMAPTVDYRFTGTADVTGTHTFQIEKDNYAVDETGTITRADMLAVIPRSIAPTPYAPTPYAPR